jgi:hypothetical protein
MPPVHWPQPERACTLVGGPLTVDTDLVGGIALAAVLACGCVAGAALWLRGIAGHAADRSAALHRDGASGLLRRRTPPVAGVEVDQPL